MYNVLPLHWSFMRLKRLAPGTILVFSGLLCIAGPAAAQSRGVFRASTGSTGTPAVETKPQPQIIVHPGNDYRHPGTVFRRQPVAYTLVPAVLMSDGSVYANFGFGYEPVHRSCSGAVLVGQPTVVAGNGVVLNAPAPTYTQPVPNQQTASQQMVSSNRTASSQYSACYSRDPYGRVQVYRF